MRAVTAIRPSDVLIAALLVALLSAGCGEAPPIVKPPPRGAGIYPSEIKFKDTVATNAKAPDKVGELAFVDTAGQKVHVGDFQGKKNVLLVITRGYTQPLCPFCRAQTSRLVSNYPQFQQANTEVLLVYPGQKGQLEEFLKNVDTVDKGQIDKVPFKILLDDNLAAVQFFGIQGNRALPSTYLFDQQGQLRFAYVGKDDGDRPSIQAMLEQVKLLGP